MLYKDSRLRPELALLLHLAGRANTHVAISKLLLFSKSFLRGTKKGPTPNKRNQPFMVTFAIKTNYIVTMPKSTHFIGQQ